MFSLYNKPKMDAEEPEAKLTISSKEKKTNPKGVVGKKIINNESNKWGSAC